jgi:hypothetical protein
VKGLSVEPSKARNVISSLKSRGISAEEYQAKNAAVRYSGHVTGSIETSTEIAQVYQYNDLSYGRADFRIYEENLSSMKLLVGIVIFKAYY